MARARGPLGIQGFWTGPFGGAFLVLFFDLIRSPLFASWSRKKSSLERLLSGPRRISRQVSGILGAERLPQGTLGASKMGSKIGSGLKKVKYQKNVGRLIRKPYFLEARVSKIGPQSGGKSVRNHIFDAEALRTAPERLLERSWRPQELKKRSWERLLAGVGPKMNSE